MNNEQNAIGISRRKVLAGLGMVGVASAGAGFGTTAYFSDEESFEGNTLTAGRLELLVDWEEHYDMGEGFKTIDVFPDTDGDGEQDFGNYTPCELASHASLDSEYRSIIDYRSGEITRGDEGEESEPLVYLDDVKPGDCWEATLSYHLCDNPGCVWFRILGTDFEHGPDESTHLADEAYARVWYDVADGTYAVPTYDGDGNLLDEDDWDEVTVDAGDNSYLDGVEPLIAQGTLRDVLEELESGVLLDADPMSAPTPEDGDGSDGDVCIELEKYDDTPDQVGIYEFEGEDGDQIELEITAFHEKEDGTVVGFDWESNFGICLIAVKGGQEYENNVYNCATSGTAFAPIGAGQGGLERFEISHFVPWYCPDVEEEPPEIVCHPAEETFYVGFEWCLPTSVGNEVQQDSLAFDIEFYTEQSRHNPDPVNPFAGSDGGNDST